MIYQKVFPCGCSIELQIEYDWMDGKIVIEAEEINECHHKTSEGGEEQLRTKVYPPIG